MFWNFCRVAVLVALPVTGFAQEWVTTLKEDVFSGKNDATMIGGWDKQLTLYASCQGGKEIGLAVITKDKSPALYAGVAATLVVKVDGADAHRFEATGYMHNENYGGFQVDANAEGLLDTLMEIGGARRKILVGVQVQNFDIKLSEEMRTNGSGKAVSRLLRNCEVK